MSDIDFFFTHIRYRDIIQLLISDTDIDIFGCGITTLWLICIVMSRWKHKYCQFVIEVIYFF